MAEQTQQRGTIGPLLAGDRMLPNSPSAEMAVLGCMLLEPACIDAVSGKLKLPGCFFNPAHQQLFELLVRLANEKPRDAIDLITVADALRAAGLLEKVGGHAGLTQMMNMVPSAANVEQYVGIVRDNAILRRLVQTGAEIAARAYDPQESVPALIDRIETEIFSVAKLQGTGELVPVRDLINDAIHYLDKLNAKDPTILGLQTGYADLDRLITGLRAGEMFVLAARPSVGKTALALNIATNIALRSSGNSAPKAVGIFSLEMSAHLLVVRLLCSLARVNIGDIRDAALSNARWNEVMDAAHRIHSAPLFIDDSGDLDILELRAKARRLKQKEDISLLIIDYLQLLKPAGQNRNSTRENDVSQISGGIKSLAKELNIPIIVLAQLNRQAEQTDKPRLAHLRESGAIEQDADVVALLHRERGIEATPGDIHEGTDAELILAKHRNGPTGIVRLTFIPAYTQFKDRSPVSDRDVPGSRV